MKINKSTLLSFVLLVVIASLYRIIPGRPLGFAPQIAMAVFGGAVIADKKMSFLLPLLSMLISDVLYEILFRAGASSIPGFYDGQVVNYILFAAITCIGFFVKKENIISITGGALAGTFAFFILSNFAVWIGGGLDINNLPYPKTIAGLQTCYVAGLPFLKGSLAATFVFGAILFGGNYLVEKFWIRKSAIA